jgi:hypothetical protein
LCSRLRDRYDFLLRNVPLYTRKRKHSKKRRLIGEIDVIGMKEGMCDIYEVKCSYRITKARKQLKKIRKLVSRNSRIRNLFFFCGESGQIVSV